MASLVDGQTAAPLFQTALFGLRKSGLCGFACSCKEKILPSKDGIATEFFIDVSSMLGC